MNSSNIFLSSIYIEKLPYVLLLIFGIRTLLNSFELRLPSSIFIVSSSPYFLSHRFRAAKIQPPLLLHQIFSYLFSNFFFLPFLSYFCSFTLPYSSIFTPPLSLSGRKGTIIIYSSKHFLKKICFFFENREKCLILVIS